MNRHLNLFHTYTKEHRETFQLENDLTRALAVALQEEAFLLYALVQHVVGYDQETFSKLFSSIESETEIEISIQENVANIEGFSRIYAVGISEAELNTKVFFNQKRTQQTRRLTDLTIKFQDALILFEVKPAAFGLTNQLFNQAMDAAEGKIEENDIQNFVIPVDLNWKVLMQICMRISSFQTYISRESRVLKDFIELIKKHNPRWLPVSSLASLNFEDDRARIRQRIDMALCQSEFKLEAKGRMGYSIDTGWASEMLFGFERKDKEDYLVASIWPGNTKGQGWHLFKEKNTLPIFKNELVIQGKPYSVKQAFHLKFSHFQKYVTSIDGRLDVIEIPFLTKSGFSNFSGRKKRGENDWADVQQFFDEHFIAEFDWRKESAFEETLINSGKSYFDLSFGFQVSICIPYNVVASIDRKDDDINPLFEFLEEIKGAMENVLIG